MALKMSHIREAGSDDVSLLSRLIRQAYRDVAEKFQLTPANCPKHPSNCTDEWIENDCARGVRYFILVDGDKPAGCVAFERVDTDLCYLERLAVLPHARNKGFGRQLVDHVLQIAREQQAKEMSIGIIAGQTKLKQWYQKLGFIETETKEFSLLPFSVTLMSYTLWA